MTPQSPSISGVLSGNSGSSIFKSSLGRDNYGGIVVTIVQVRQLAVIIRRIILGNTLL